MFSNVADVSDATWTSTWSKDQPHGGWSAKLGNMYAFHDRTSYSNGMHSEMAFQFVWEEGGGDIGIIIRNQL